MTTNNNNQPETNALTFTAEQAVWVKATIKDKSMHKDNSWYVFVAGGDFAHVPEDGIRTTEQIILENTTMDSPTMYRFFDPVYGAENTKIASRNAEQNAKPTTISNTETVTEYDRNRRFKKGDKVRIVERWGRTPWLNCSNLELGETYTVYADEEVEDEEIYLEAYDDSEGISPFFLDLVKPATEPKYWVKESTLCYYINFKGADDCIYTALYMNKDLYTLEEAQAECDRLNQKDQNNA